MEQNEATHNLPTQKEQAITEQIWLHYYNQFLFDNGAISESEYKRMKSKINSRKASFLAH